MLLAALLAPGCVDLSRPGVLNRPVDHEDGATDDPPEALPGHDAGAFDHAGDAAAADAALAAADAPPAGDAAAGLSDLALTTPEADLAPPAPDAGLDDGGPVDAVVSEAASPDLAESSLSQGLALYLKLDESSGVAVLDSSGHGRQGLYTGADGIPAPGTDAPATRFPDPLSRAFTLAKRHAIQVTDVPAILRQVPEVTVALWYRATTLDTSGSELISAGDSLFLRLRAGGGTIDFGRWVTTSPGVAVSSTCRLAVAAALDGQWHHVAAVSTATSARAYFDGVERCAVGVSGTIAYDRGLDLWLGRHGKGNIDIDFEGNLDEVRLYTRALAPAEVAALAEGRE